MLSLKQCLRDIANFVDISVGVQQGHLKVGQLLIQWGHVTSHQTAQRVTTEYYFPMTYSQNPVVFGQCLDPTVYPELFNVTVYNVTVTKFTMGFVCNHSTLNNIKAVWIAIGKA